MSTSGGYVNTQSILHFFSPLPQSYTSFLKELVNFILVRSGGLIVPETKAFNLSAQVEQYTQSGNSSILHTIPLICFHYNPSEPPLSMTWKVGLMPHLITGFIFIVKWYFAMWASVHWEQVRPNSLHLDQRTTSRYWHLSVTIDLSWFCSGDLEAERFISHCHQFTEAFSILDFCE